MPYPSNPELYPSEFADVFERAEKSPVRITLESPGEAANLRHRLHAYRRAVEKARMPGWSRLRNVTIGISENVLTLRASPLASALVEEKSEPSEEELEQFLKAMNEGEQK